MEAILKQEFIIKPRKRGEGVADGVSANPRDFQKGGFPQLCEQGDNNCQIK